MTSTTIVGVSTGTLVWTLLGSVGLIGLVAVLSPRCFSALAVRSNHWVDTAKLLACLDRPIDIDRHVLPFSRALGIAVIAAVCTMGVLYAKYGLGF